MKTLINIQDEYIATVNAGIARWSHRKLGGHMSRIQAGARRNAERGLVKLGFNPDQIKQVIQQAKDMAELERIADDSVD